MNPRSADYFAKAPYTGTRSQLRIPDTQRYRSSSISAMTSSETAAEKATRADEKARLDEIHQEELLDRQAACAERKANSTPTRSPQKSSSTPTKSPRKLAQMLS
jgi:hypothetical protein